MRRAVLIVIATLVALPGIPALVIWLFGPTVAPPRITQATHLAVADAYFESMVAEGYPPGFVVSVYQDGQERFSKAYGSRNIDGEPMTLNTSVRWWSVTKLVTAAAALVLIDQGQLSLDEPANKFLPFLRLTNEAGEPRSITILQLLNHSAGVQDNMPEGLGQLRFPGQPLVDQVAYAEALMTSRQTLGFEPGSQAEYSNTAYILLGAIIQNVSGMPFEDFVRAKILQPLAMNATDFVFPADLPYADGTHPILHFVTPFLALLGNAASAAVKELDGGLIWFDEFYLDYTGSTSLNGSVCDMARFNQMILNRGELNGVRILSKPATEMFLRAHFIRLNGAPPWTMQGIGFRRPPVDPESPRNKLLHSGGGPGFSVHNVIYPDENLTYAFVANGTDLPREAISEMLDHIDWRMPSTAAASGCGQL